MAKSVVETSRRITMLIR